MKNQFKKWPKMTFNDLQMTLKPKPLHHCVCHEKAVKSCFTFLSSNYYNSWSIDEKPLKNIKKTKNYLEMTFNDLQITLRSKTTAPLCLSWWSRRKLSTFLSSNSYNSLSIHEKSVKNIKKTKNDLEMTFNDLQTTLRP